MPLFPELTGLDNLLLWYKCRKKDLSERLEKDLLLNLQIKDLLNLKVNKMSGGMKKKLSIACALSENPQILLLDFYSDVWNGLIKFDNNQYIVNRLDKWKASEIYDELQMKETWGCSDSDMYLYCWMEHFDSFMGKIKRYLPSTYVFVNSCKLMTKYIDNNHIMKYGNGNKNIKKLNCIWQRMDEFAEQCGAKRIVYNKDYLINMNYPFGGLHYVHYEKQFYKDAFNQLVRLIDVLKI